MPGFVEAVGPVAKIGIIDDGAPRQLVIGVAQALPLGSVMAAMRPKGSRVYLVTASGSPTLIRILMRSTGAPNAS